MAAASNPPFVSVEEYLDTTYPDGDREYLDGQIVERNMGTPNHSALQMILVAHFAALRKHFNLAVRPECRMRIDETHYRIPDILVMAKPFQQTDRAVLEAPLLVIEILSPDDRMRATLTRLREYERRGVRYIIQMDPEERTTSTFVNGDLVRRDLVSLDLPGGGSLPFDTRELLALLDEE